MNYGKERTYDQKRLISETKESVESIEDILRPLTLSLTQFEKQNGKTISQLREIIYYLMQLYEVDYLIQSSIEKDTENDSKLQQAADKGFDKALQNLCLLDSLNKKNADRINSNLIMLFTYSRVSFRGIANALVLDNYNEVSRMVYAMNFIKNKVHPKGIVEKMIYSIFQIVLLLLRNIQIYGKSNKTTDIGAKFNILYSISSSFEKIYDEISKFEVESKFTLDTFGYISLSWAIKVLAESIEDILKSLTQFDEQKEKKLSKLRNYFYYFRQSHTKKGRETKRKILNIASKNNAVNLDIAHNIFDENYPKLQRNIDDLLGNLYLLESVDKMNANLINLSICFQQSFKAIVNALVLDNYTEANKIDDIKNKVQAFASKSIIEEMVYSASQIALLLSKNIQIYERANKIIDMDTKLEFFDSISSSFEKIYDEISKFIIETELLFFDTLAYISLLWAIKVNEYAYTLAEEKNDLEGLKEYTLHLCSLYGRVANRLLTSNPPKALEYFDKVLNTIDSTKPLSFTDDELSILNMTEIGAKTAKLTISSFFSKNFDGIDNSIAMIDEMKEKIEDESVRNLLELSKKGNILSKLWIQFFTSFQQKDLQGAKNFIPEIISLAEKIKGHPPIELPEEAWQDFLVISSKKSEYARMLGESQIDLAQGMSILLDEMSNDIPNHKQIESAQSHLERSSTFSPELLAQMRIDIIAYNELAKCYEKLGEKNKEGENLRDAIANFDLAADWYKKAGKIAPMIFTVFDAKSNLCNSHAGYIQALRESQNGSIKTAIQQCEKCGDVINETKKFLDKMKVLEFSGIFPSQIAHEIEYLEKHIDNLKDELNRKYRGKRRNLIVLAGCFIAMVIISNRYISGYIVGIGVFREILIDVVFVAGVIVAVYKLFASIVGKKPI